LVEVSVQEYLEMLHRGDVREIWIEKNELTARMNSDCRLGAKECPSIHLILPPSFVEIPEAFGKLSEGLPPAHVHYEGNSR
jgi:hypothetical protein